MDNGIKLYRAGEHLDSVKSRDSTIHLVARGDNTEVWVQYIKEGGRFCLDPSPDWDGLEFFRVERGSVRWVDRQEEVVLNAGDSVAAQDFKEPANFVCLSDVSLVYVSSQPVFHMLSQQVQELMSLAVEIEEHDEYTAGHCRRIRDLSVAVGELVRLTPTQIDRLTFGAFLHDVGKARIPAEILSKPGPLDQDEWEVMKTHPTLGREMVENTFVEAAGYIIEQHHERMDGSGYPNGLSGKDVSVEAQIVSVVDSFDAMTTNRPYRKGMPYIDALNEIRACSGRLYSEDIVEAFNEVIIKQEEKTGGSSQ